MNLAPIDISLTEDNVIASLVNLSYTRSVAQYANKGESPTLVRYSDEELINELKYRLSLKKY